VVLASIFTSSSLARFGCLEKTTASASTSTRHIQNRAGPLVRPFRRLVQQQVPASYRMFPPLPTFGVSSCAKKDVIRCCHLDISNVDQEIPLQLPRTAAWSHLPLGQRGRPSSDGSYAKHQVFGATRDSIQVWKRLRLLLRWKELGDLIRPIIPAIGKRRQYHFPFKISRGMVERGKTDQNRARGVRKYGWLEAFAGTLEERLVEIRDHRDAANVTCEGVFRVLHQSS
jgi:hypothetical protein